MTRTVLVVDDEPAVMSLMRGVLRLAGYRVVEATDGEQAIVRLEAELPDAVLLDLVLPGIDGWEVLHRVRADSRLRHTPVIVISAYTGDGTETKAEKLGCHGFLQKPFSIHELIRRIQGLFGATA